MKLQLPKSKIYIAVMVLSAIFAVVLLYKGNYPVSLLIAYIMGIAEAYRSAVLVEDEEAE